MTFANLKILMARRYYRRRTVVVRPKKKWASNLKMGTLSTGDNTSTAILAQNSAQASSPTPIIVKVGNIKLQGDASVQVPSGSGGTVMTFVIVIFYLPEGVTLGSSTASSVVTQHPEWIMAWKQIDTPTTVGPVTLSSNSFSVSSRLKRNLNSGDRICIGYIQDGVQNTVAVKYTAQYWTCAN